MEFYIGMAFGAAFAGLAFLADHYVFGLPSERTLERARKEAYFRRYAREEALRQDEEWRI